MKTENIHIKVRTFWLRTIYLGVVSIFIWFFVITLFIGLIGSPSRIGELGFLWLILASFGIIITNHVIWETIGRVRLEIASDHLKIVNVNSLFKNKIDIQYKDLRKIEYNKEKSFLPTDFWGFTKGDILLKYNDGLKINQRRFGKGLTYTETLKYVKNINDKIKTTHNIAYTA